MFEQPTQFVRAGLRALSEIELFKVPSPMWELDGRTEQGGFNVIIGPRGIFKTFLVATLALALTHKGGWFGAEALRIGPVMVVPLEDLRGWRQRWESARRAEDIPDDQRLPVYTWPHPVNFYTGHGVADLRAELERLGILHVLIDPWADAISGADENSQKDVGLAVARVKQLRSVARSVTVVQHTGLDESRERGSTVLGAAADTMMLMKRNGEPRAVTVECTKMRNGARFDPMHLEFDAEALVLRLAGVSLVPSKLSKQQQTVLDALQALARANGHAGGVPIREWQARCLTVEGVPRRTFFDAKAALLRADRVQEPAGGHFLPGRCNT